MSREKPDHAIATVFLSTHSLQPSALSYVTNTTKPKLTHPCHTLIPCHSQTCTCDGSTPHTSNSTITNFLCYATTYLFYYNILFSLCVCWLFNSLFSDLLISASTLNLCTMQPPSICFQLHITGSH